MLQHVSSSLAFTDAHCHVTLTSDAAGDLGVGAPLMSTLRVRTAAGRRTRDEEPASRCELLVRMRVPGWATAARAELLPALDAADGAGGSGRSAVPLSPDPLPSSFISHELRHGEGLRVAVWMRSELRHVTGELVGGHDHAHHGHAHSLHTPADAPTSASTSSAAHAGGSAGGSGGGGGARLFGDGGATSRVFRETRINGAGAALRGVTHGPLLLAALTDGERTIRTPQGVVGGRAGVDAGEPVDRWVRPVPAAFRRQLVSIETLPTGPQREAGWTAPAASAVAGVVESLATWNASAELSSSCSNALPDADGRARARGSSSRLMLAHAGIGQPVSLVPRPPDPPALARRRGGSDAVNAATWRIAPSATSMDSVSTGATPLAAAAQSFAIEPFDRPGVLLSLGSRRRNEGAGGRRPLLLLPAQPAGRDAGQRWRFRPLPSPPTQDQTQCSMPLMHVAVEVVDGARDGGDVVVSSSRPAAGGGVTTFLEVGERGSADALTFVLQAPRALYPPAAHFAFSNVTCRADEKAPSASLASCRSAYLMIPMRELIDETYSAHLCISDALSVPAFCH